MKFVILKSDANGKGYFSIIGAWHRPHFLEESRKHEARQFETEQSARQFIKEFLGNSRKYKVECID